MFKLKYTGERFRDARLPVDVLSDLPAFRDLILSFAKSEFKRRNPHRSRVPRGFSESLSFDLVNVESGSAVPALDWNRDVAQQTLPGLSDEIGELVESSYKEVTRLVDDAAHGIYPSSLSPDKVRALNKFGAGLRDQESIEFPDTLGHRGNVICLTPLRRKQILTHVKDTYQERYEEIGVLRGCFVDNVRGSYVVVETGDYGNISIPLEAERISEEFDGNIFRDVQFAIQIELDNQDKLRHVVYVYSIEINENDEGLEKALKRIDEISRYETGWLEGEGEKIAAIAIENSVNFVKKRPVLCGGFKIFPVEDGGVQIELENNGWDYTIEFRADAHIEIFGIEIDGSEEMGPEEFDFMGQNFLARYDELIGLGG